MAIDAGASIVAQESLVQAGLMLDNVVDYAIIAMDQEGAITAWNPGAERIFLYPAQDALGLSGEVLYTAEDQDNGRFLTELELALQTGSATNERWHRRRDGTRFWASGTVMPMAAAGQPVSGFVSVMRDNTEARLASERQALLLAEMNHRVKNVFSMVSAVSSQTLRRASSLETFQDAFNARLQVMSRAQDLLLRTEWSDAGLHDVIATALAPYGLETGAITLDGEAVPVGADLVVMAGLAFHELATNAIKYGALSQPGGRVAVTWTAAAGNVVCDWRESGGPTVTPPTSLGFGSRLLERGLEPHGTVTLDFKPEGLTCRLKFPTPAQR